MIDAVITINGAEVTITGNPTLERNVKEELDTGKLLIESTRAKRYEMYDKVVVTTPYNVEEQYLVQADNPIQLNATEHQHNLTLFENIAFFNTVYPADRSFKVIDQTLEDILTAYKRELEAYHNIIITWTTIPQAVLDETIPFKEFAGLNLSSILLSLMRKIWAVPKVNRIGDNWDIYPLYHNERNNSISKESISKISQQNNVDYATQVKSQLKNAVNERTIDEVSWFPSESGYILPKSSTLEKIDSNLQYEVDSNIIALLKVEAVGVEYEALNDDTGVVDTLYIDVDISSYIVQHETYALLTVIPSSTAPLTIDQTDNIQNHIRYTVGKQYITNLFESTTGGIIFDYNSYYLIYAIRREVTVNKALYFTSNYISAPVIQPLDTEDVKMRFKYIRQRNMDLVHVRKTKGAMNDTTTIHQQRDASVEINEYKKNLQLYANRMGNNENSKTKMFTYPDEPYELFDYTDEKTIVTRVQNTYHNLFVYCEYEESESFGNIEAEYALMRRSDPYTINAKAVTTNLIVQELIEFSEVSRDLDTRFTSDARRLLLGLFEAVTISLDKVSVGVFKPLSTGWNDSYAIHMPVAISGDGNLITIHVQFPHQTIAGKTYYDLETDTYEDYLNPLPYTETDGTLENYELYFTPDILFEDLGEYPLILDETLYLASEYTNDSIVEPIDLDVAASFAVTLQASFIADAHIFIGNAMASSNYFVKDQATTTAIKIYTSTKPYGQYDQSPRDYDTDNTATISYSYSFANRTHTITPTSAMNYFSIVKDGAILLAINKPIAAGQTYIVNVNHLSDTIPVATFETEAFMSVTGSIAITTKVNLTFATNADVTVTADGVEYYTKVNLPFATEATVSVSAEMAYITSVNLPFETTADTIVSAEMLYDTVVNESAGIEANVNVSAELSYYTVRDIEYATEADVTVSVEMTYYRAGDITQSFEADVSVAITTSYTASLNPEPVEWIEIGAGTPTGGNCIVIGDLGNIKEEDTSYCSFTNNGASYESATDESTTKPQCQDGAEYTLCILFDGTWWCQDYIGGEVEDTTLYECQLK